MPPWKKKKTTHTHTSLQTSARPSFPPDVFPQETKQNRKKLKLQRWPTYTCPFPILPPVLSGSSQSSQKGDGWGTLRDGTGAPTGKRHSSDQGGCLSSHGRWPQRAHPQPMGGSGLGCCCVGTLPDPYTCSSTQMTALFYFPRFSPLLPVSLQWVIR